MIEVLEGAIAADDTNAVQDAIFNLGQIRTPDNMIPDELALEILSILQRQELWQSRLSGHILNFFEFESRRLSDNSKDKCRAFLAEWGAQFTDVLSTQVVTELIHGPYLKLKESKALH